MSNLEIFVFVIVPIGIVLMCIGGLLVQRRANLEIKARMAMVKRAHADNLGQSKPEAARSSSQAVYATSGSMNVDARRDMFGTPRDEPVEGLQTYRRGLKSEVPGTSVH